MEIRKRIIEKAHELTKKAALISDKFPKSTMIAIAVDMAEWAYNNLIEEPVSEDLEEAVNAYIGYAPEVDECSSVYGKRKAFKAGANWQRSQLMRNAIEVVISDDTTICNAIEVMKLQEKYKGQKVRITVIKEE